MSFRCCDRWFRSYQHLQQHKDDSPRHRICNDCDREFPTWDGLKEHYVQSPQHFYCQYCDKHFSSQYALDDHCDSKHYYCRECRKVFENERGLHEHLMQSENHHYCKSCKEDFESENDLHDHFKESAKHHYCESCEKDFQSESNLRNHLNSSTHRPRTIGCLFRGSCDQSFIDRSHLVLHLESGTCTSGVDRNTVNRYVRRFDRDNFITDPSRLLTGSDSDSDSSSRIEYFPTEATWNGSAYECDLCHQEFQKLPHLKQHVNSPVHDERMYFCPLGTCGRRFVALGGLCQHIDSQSCGVSRFRLVEDTLNDILGRIRLLTFR